MPRKKKTPLQTRKENREKPPLWCPSDAEWGGYINIRLDDQQKEQFHAWYAESSAEVGVYLEDFLASGGKFSVAYDDENECYIATLAGSLLLQDDRARYTSSSRASTVTETMALAFWKHFILCAEDYSLFLPKTNRLMNWG